MQPFTTSFDLTWLFQLSFYVLIIIFAFHALFLTYHWFTYGGNKKLSTTALGLYLIGGAILFLTFGITLSMQ
jgi:hypothetical protein